MIDFSEAVKLLPDKKKFEKKVERIISDNIYDFPFETEEGGATDDEEYEIVNFNYDDEHEITVNVVITYTENLPTSCCDITLEGDHYSAKFEVTIDRESGDSMLDTKGYKSYPGRSTRDEF